MKPDTTWKEEVVSHAKEYARMSYLVSEENHSPNEEISALDRLLGVVESFLSSSQALARREGIEEAMRVVEESKKWAEEGLKEIPNSLIHTAVLAVIEDRLQALQEKLDTKRV